MQNAELFQIRHRQLRETVQKQNLESMLLLSQALRQLVGDGSRLVDLVNREHRIPITFKVGMSSVERAAEMHDLKLPEPTLHFLGKFPHNEPKKDLKIDQFLKFPIAKFESQHFSVLTLIKTCANRLGGVHAGEPVGDSTEESQVRQFGDNLSQLGMHHAFASLVLVAGVTFEALQPLSDKLRNPNG